jgi:transposase
MLPHDFPDWTVVYQQLQRWIHARVFERIAGVQLVVVKHSEAKKGFVLLPRRWVVERTFGWLGRFRRLTRDFERLSETLAAWHWLAYIMIAIRLLGFESQ